MVINRFNQLLESTMGDVKPLISEQNSQQKNPWTQVEKSLSKIGNPKILRFKYEGVPVTSLNWGSHKAPGADWGLSVSSDKNDLIFVTKNSEKGKLFEKITGKKLEYNNLSKNWSSYDYKLDYNNPTKVTTLVSQLINSLS